VVGGGTRGGVKTYRYNCLGDWNVGGKISHLNLGGSLCVRGRTIEWGYNHEESVIKSGRL